MPFEKKLHPKSNNKPRTHARKHKKFIDIACAVNWLCKQTTIWWRIVVIRTDCIHILGVRVLLRNEHWSHTQYTYATCSFSILVFFSLDYLFILRSYAPPKRKKNFGHSFILFYCIAHQHCQIRFCPWVCFWLVVCAVWNVTLGMGTS